MLVLRFMVEPPRTDTRVCLPRAPHVAVLHSVVQHVPWCVALTRHQAPVGFAHITGLSTYPAQISSVAAIVPDDGLGLQLTDHAKGLGPAVIGLAVNTTRLVSPSIPAIAAVSSVEPHLKDFSVVGQQFAQLVAEILYVGRTPVFWVIPVPG